MNEIEMGYVKTVYVNTGTYASPVWVEIDLAGDLEEGEPVDQIEIQARGAARQGAKIYGPGLTDHMINFDSLIPQAGESNAAFTELQDAQRGRDTADVVLVAGGLITVDGLNAKRGIYYVFGGTENHPVGGVATRRFELKAALNADQDVPIYGTTSSGGFVPSS